MAIKVEEDGGLIKGKPFSMYDRNFSEQEMLKQEKSIGFSLSEIRDFFGISEKDIRSFSPLTLAYIGDAIYEIIIRSLLVESGNAPVGKLHKRASKIVKAEAQKNSMGKIEPLLTEGELAIYKRGRNAKSYTSAKNASVIDYRIATGFEALVGYLYLEGNNERLLELVKVGLEGMLEE